MGRASGGELDKGGQKLRQTDRKSVGAHWVKNYILMGLSTVSWLGNDCMGATLVGNRWITEVFVQISIIWCSLLFGLTVDRIELPAFNELNQNR